MIIIISSVFIAIAYVAVKCRCLKATRAKKCWAGKTATVINKSNFRAEQSVSSNLEREGRTGKYWPSVRTATTEGQYSPVRPEQARLVSGLLYGTVSDSKMQWHSVSDSKMQLQKRFVTESDKSSC